MLHVSICCQETNNMLTICSDSLIKRVDCERGHHVLKPISPPKSLMELTADRIRDAIIDGEFELGSKVSEQSLADTLGISRSPVREALALLQIEGLIRVLPKRGSFIFMPDAKTVKDLCEHRAILESACVEMAITRNHDALIKGLQHGSDMMQRAIDRDAATDYSAGDLHFHRAIIDASDNASIAKIYTRTIGPLLALRTHLFTTMTAHLDRSMDEHAALLDACTREDVPRAQAVLKQHILHLYEAYDATQEHATKQAHPKLSVVK